MNSIIRLVAVVAALVLLLNITPSWGQPVCVAPGCNPTTSGTGGNTAGGTGALDTLNAQGERNTAFGANALTSTSSGDGNTAVGFNAMFFNSTGSHNTAIGENALLVNQGSDNTAIDYHALFNNTLGDQNTAIGHEALVNATSAFNTAIGYRALFSNTGGHQNTAIGHRALVNNTAGAYNTATGLAALEANTTGIENTATGRFALVRNTTGNNNTANGFEALLNNETANLNTGVGVQALNDNVAGLQNTAVGAKALKKSTGTKNIGIGYQAGVTLQTGNNNIYIGNQGAGDEFQTIRIGTAQTGRFIAGIANAAVGNAATVIIDTTTGQLGVPLSSARYKQDIAPMGTRSEKVLDLRPVTFAYRDDARAVTHYGLIAEEVATVYPDLVTRTASGEVQTVKYQELIPMLLNELQRQRHEFQQALHSQQQELAELRALVGQGRGKVVLGGTGE